MSSTLILASASPRRRELLAQLGATFRVEVADLDERRLPGEGAEACVRRLAREKAEAVYRRFAAQDAVAAPRIAVLGADTEVELDGELLGKPRDREHGLELLARLSGRRHRVLSAVALVDANGCEVALSLSTVEFRPLTAAEAEAYWASGEPLGKAGGYAIQGFGAEFIAGLQGSYSGVMGLPLFETAQLLRRAGVPLWHISGP